MPHKLIFGHLFDHLVGQGEQLVRDFEAERLSGLEVNYELKLGRQYDRKLSWLVAPENAASIDAGLMIGICSARSVAHQTTCFGNLAIRVNRGQSILCRQYSKATAFVCKQGIGPNVEDVGPLAREYCQSTFDLPVVANVKIPRPQVHRLHRRRYVCRIRRVVRIVGVTSSAIDFAFGTSSRKSSTR